MAKKWLKRGNKRYCYIHFTFLSIVLVILLNERDDIRKILFPKWDRDSSIGIATRYGWTVRGSNPGWGWDFRHPSRPAIGPTQPPVEWVTSHFPGIRWPRRGVKHPPRSSAKLRERVELQLYSPFDSSWPVLGWNLLVFYFCLNLYLYLLLLNCCNLFLKVSKANVAQPQKITKL